MSLHEPGLLPKALRAVRVDGLHHNRGALAQDFELRSWHLYLGWPLQGSGF